MNAILNYLRYPSTYQGLIALVVALGVNIEPELEKTIISIGLAIGGFIALKFSDSDVKAKK